LVSHWPRITECGLSTYSVSVCLSVSLSVCLSARMSQRPHVQISLNFYFTCGSDCEVLWWVCLSVGVSVCLSVRLSTRISVEPHAWCLPIFCACLLCPWLGRPPACLRCIAYRREVVFFSVDNALSARKGWWECTAWAEYAIYDCLVCLCCLWPWFGFPLMTMQYIIYFWFCGWCGSHNGANTGMFSVANYSPRLTKGVAEFRGQSVLSLIAWLIIIIIIIIIIIRKFITRTCSQALSMNRRRDSSSGWNSHVWMCVVQPYTFGAIINRDDCFKLLVTHGARLQLSWAAPHATSVASGGSRSQSPGPDAASSDSSPPASAKAERTFRMSDLRDDLDDDDRLLLMSST